MIELDEGRHAQVSLVSSSTDDSKLTLRMVPDQPGIASRILGPVAAAGIPVDVIVQNISSDGFTDFTFTVNRKDADKSATVLSTVAKDLHAGQVDRDDEIAKVSLIGEGMQQHSGVASKAFTALADEGINIQMISTSDIKITLVLAQRYEELAVRALHDVFFAN